MVSWKKRKGRSGAMLEDDRSYDKRRRGELKHALSGIPRAGGRQTRPCLEGEKERAYLKKKKSRAIILLPGRIPSRKKGIRIE